MLIFLILFCKQFLFFIFYGCTSVVVATNLVLPFRDMSISKIVTLLYVDKIFFKLYHNL